jgi:uncharacterized protein YabN with tetrapyrrole methylase and pyrophosphatase domain
MDETPKLVLTGSGIKTISHLSLEAKQSIENANHVLFLVNEPVMEQYIKKLNNEHENLEDLYFKASTREEAYTNITDKIVSSCLNKKGQTCVVIYGHPTVFAKPGLDAVKKLKAISIKSHILPAISTEDCLFADLEINPGLQGCLSIDATEFLLRNYSNTPYSHLVLWQPGMIGSKTHEFHSMRKQLLSSLYKKLNCCYPKEHPIVLYEAAIYPGLKPLIQQTALYNLPEYDFNTLTTLYIPPLQKADKNKQLIDDLKIDYIEV